MRKFETGATRDQDDTKPDYRGYLSPIVLEAFGQYMLANQIQADGTKRDSDNWKKGIPMDVYMSSFWRHFMEVYKNHEVGILDVNDQIEALCACMFNVQGMLFELLMARK